MPVQIPPRSVIRLVRSELIEFFTRLAQVEVPRGTIATSWFRDEQHNLRVGGAPFSQHRLALALDVRTSDPAALVISARQAGIVAVDEGSHVHLQARPAGTLAPRLFRV